MKINYHTFQQLALYSLFAMCIGLLAVSCASEEAEEEPAEEVQEAPPPPPPPATTYKEPEDMKEHVEEDQTVVRYHEERMTYHPGVVAGTGAAVATDDTDAADEAKKALDQRPFDVPPIYGKKCVEQNDPTECSSKGVATYLANNIQLPDEAKDYQNHKEIISFVVKTNGQVDDSDVRFVPQENTCHPCAAEALRLVKEMPGWVPAMKNGKPVEARVTLPIRFVVD